MILTLKRRSLPDDLIRRTARKIPVLNLRENLRQLANRFDGFRSTVRKVEWYQDMISI